MKLYIFIEIMLLAEITKKVTIIASPARFCV